MLFLTWILIFSFSFFRWDINLFLKKEHKFQKVWWCGGMGLVAPNDPPTLRSWFIITHIRILGFIYNHIYKKSNSLILYAHTNIHHDSIFALNHKQFHSTYNYTHTIHAELKTLFNLLFILNHMLLDSIFFLYLEHTLEHMDHQ